MNYSLKHFLEHLGFHNCCYYVFILFFLFVLTSKCAIQINMIDWLIDRSENVSLLFYSPVALHHKFNTLHFIRSLFCPLSSDWPEGHLDIWRSVTIGCVESRWPLFCMPQHRLTLLWRWKPSILKEMDSFCQNKWWTNGQRENCVDVKEKTMWPDKRHLFKYQLQCKYIFEYLATKIWVFPQIFVGSQWCCIIIPPWKIIIHIFLMMMRAVCKLLIRFILYNKVEVFCVALDSAFHLPN